MLPFHLQGHQSQERKPCMALSPNHQLTFPSLTFCWSSSFRHPNWHEFDVAWSALPPSFLSSHFSSWIPCFPLCFLTGRAQPWSDLKRCTYKTGLLLHHSQFLGRWSNQRRNVWLFICLPIVVMARRAEAFSEAELWPPEQTALWLSSSSQQWVAWWRRVSSWSDQSYSLYVPYGGFLCNLIFTVLLSR